MESLVSDIERARKRLSNGRQKINEVLDTVIDSLATFVDSEPPSESEPEFQQRVSNLFEEVNSFGPLKKVYKEHKESYAYISKLSKSINSQFPSTVDSLCRPSEPGLNADCMREALYTYLTREGYHEVSDLLEASFPIDEESLEMRSKFKEIYDVVSGLSESNIQDALDWVQKHSSDLKNEADNLIFSLHKLKFIHFLRSGDPALAVEYSRQHFSRFSTSHQAEIQQLSGACLYLSRPENSPYRELLDPNYDKIVARKLTEVWCQVIGIPLTAGFITVFAAGNEVLNELVKMASVIGGRVWTEPMPSELKLSSELKFHTIFVCPVSREIATPENPPVLLTCGHMLCKSSMERMLTGAGRKLKCPTCPVEVLEKDIRKVTIM